MSTIEADPLAHDFKVILVAPNISEQMGGEAIKALQIYMELERQGVPVHQVTHERVKAEQVRKFPGMSVSYIGDTKLEKLLCRFELLGPLLGIVFFRSANKRVEQLLRENPNAGVHFTSPVSPILPHPRLKNATVVIGPLNGNIHYPPAFRHREGFAYKVRRWLHAPMQALHRIAYSGNRNADALLVAGGERTYSSLRMAGCRDEQFVDSIDSGVLDRLLESPRIEHHGKNLRFVHNGRLVAHKGTDLIIKALTKTRNTVELDVIGRGPERDGLIRLTEELGLQDRVNFIEWFPDHSELARRMGIYRAFVFPSLAEANGIVVQEAMIQGLPVIACNWGGPALLVTPETGFLIDPNSEEYVIQELASKMDILAEDGDLAERMSLNGRALAVRDGFIWSEVIRNWYGVYKCIYSKRDAARN
jgi:glycosyltransferase involved in cell wall biosynthesis